MCFYNVNCTRYKLHSPPKIGQQESSRNMTDNRHQIAVFSDGPVSTFKDDSNVLQQTSLAFFLIIFKQGFTALHKWGGVQPINTQVT